MARSTPAAQVPTVAGLDPSLTAPSADGDTIPAGRVLLWVVNDSGSSVTVGIPTPRTLGGLAVSDGGGAVPAGAQRIYGPFPASLFARASTEEVDPGLVWVSYSSVTDVTRALLAV